MPILPWDLTNENIENTYQRLVQTPDGINYYDGTGSLLPLSSSFLSTASATGNTITFTKGDGSTFPVTVTGGGSGTPGGPNTSVQFNGNGTFSGSNVFTFNSASNSLTLTGSLNVSGSTTQIGNNTLLGNTTLSGSIIISGSTTTPTVQIYGNTTHNGYIRFDPVTTNINQSISASYIYVSGSTQDLYFSQNGSGYSNTTRLRWLESNLYTGILKGGILSSTPGTTTFQVTGGEGIILSMNASVTQDPYPTIKLVSWPTQTLPITYSGSAKISYIGIDNTGTVIQQTVPWGTNDIDQWDNSISLGVVLTLSGSVSTGVFNAPQIGYGQSQKTDDFFRAFGPLKVSGHTLLASGSTLGIKKTGGSSYREGANYAINPNHPSTVVENAISTSKIYRYYLSGSTPIIDTGVANAGYTFIDPTQYVNTATGQLTTVYGNNSNQWRWTIQRVFWIPNSPTNAFIVYYGNAEYTTLIDAQNAISTEPFSEAPNTSQNAIFVGYILVRKGCTDLSDTTGTNAVLVQGGLFRNVGGNGGSGTAASTTLASLSDVSITSPTYGDLLMYDTTVWNNTKTLSGSYTLSGSLTTNDGVKVQTLTASFVSASGGITGSLFGTASWASSSISSSYSATASLAPNYVLNSATSSFVQNSQTSSMTVATASYITGSVFTSANPALSSSNALTASYLLPVRSGQINPVAWGTGSAPAGTAQFTASVSFSPPFPSTQYSVAFTGIGDVRFFGLVNLSRGVSSFKVSSNSVQPITDTVTWIATHNQ